VDFHVRTYRTAEEKKVSMEKSLVFGLKQGELLASYDRQSSSWKMCQLSLFVDYQQSLEIFPNSGMIRNGELYRLEKPEHPISEKGCLSLPTPAAHEGRLGYQRRPADKKGTQKSLTTVIIENQGGREKVSGQLNPEYVNWLMGFPVGWIS